MDTPPPLTPARRLLRFLIAGAAGFVVDAAVLLMLEPWLGHYVGRLASFCAAVTTTWLINRRLAFAGLAANASPAGEYVRYFGLMLVGGAINYATYAIVVKLFGAQPAVLVLGVAIGSVAGLLCNFFSARLLLYVVPDNRPAKEKEIIRMNASLVPPQALVSEHSGGVTREQFIAMGDEIVTHSLIGAAKLPRDGRLLDIGCGCGKIARPLVGYLSPQGGYDGIDITSAAIDWCRQAYREHPNFRFHLADLQSTRYNRDGSTRASNYRFPFEDDTFDVVFLGSVFTHLLPADTAHYLREIGRVLKPGGRCLATFFVLDEQARQSVSAKLTTPAFQHPYADGSCRVEVLAVPEAAIAYDEALVRRMHDEAGLRIDAINFGEWARKRLIPHWQDEVWSSKPSGR